MRGIDISNWQGGLTPSALPIDFCIAKATEENNFVDKYCDAFIQNCIQNNILWGFYHFAGKENAKTEAKFFYNNTKGYIGKGIPVLDYEIWGQHDDVKWCEDFMTEFYNHAKVWPMIYISASHCSDFVNSWIPKKCGLWVAGYPKDYTEFTQDEMPYSISPWSFAAIWQFTSGLVLGGYTLDGDLAYMDKKAWKKYAGVTSENDDTNNNSSIIDNSSSNSNRIITGRVTIELD